MGRGKIEADSLKIELIGNKILMSDERSIADKWMMLEMLS